MRLLLYHPGIAALPCETCIKYVTDIIGGSGDIATYGVTNPETGQREQVPQPRPQGTVPPCERCPKGSPQQAEEMELTRKNWEAYSHWRREKAVGVSELVRRDEICRRNFAILDLAHKSYEISQSSRLQAHEFAKLFKKD